MALVTSAGLRSIASVKDALALFGDLNFGSNAKPVDVRALALPGVSRASVIRTGPNKRTGFAVAVLEAAEAPRSLRPLARALQREVHDRPLGVLGIAGPDARWQRMIVFRPRKVSGQLGAVTVARLDVDLAHATGHDCQVLSALSWKAESPLEAAHEALDNALDVEEVTRRFYKGLVPYFDGLDRAVQNAAARNLVVAERIDAAGGSRRVAIRLLTQVLFCYFLQRKGLFAGDREYLSRAWTGRGGAYYPTVLEPLFYDALAVPESMRAGVMSLSGVPFLNGGLFERRYGDVSLDLPDELFSLDSGLLGYLDHWTFTAAEETADESEVAVDPEMLGRIFESLLPNTEREQKGTYYTPRPVVQFMCREALVARIAGDDSEKERLLRTLVTDEDPLRGLNESEPRTDIQRRLRDLDDELASLTVLDPAVGSGAFLLGMMGEILRLRSISHEALHGRLPTQEQIHAWKLHAIERTLFGVDIEPTAIELCRLRLWLTLAVELDATRPVPPLPNLEYRTVTADSLVDFVEGIPIQNTRRHEQTIGLGLFGELSADTVVRLRAEYFNAADPKEKARLRGQLLDAENSLLGDWLEGAQEELRRNPGASARIERLKAQLKSPDRGYPVFMPGFSAPDVWANGGWDIVIMNPPYVGRRAIPQRYAQGTLSAIEHHYGATHDTMILFGERALQLIRPGGAIAMICNDSLFTSTDGESLRQKLVDSVEVRTFARTRCFEGQAITGGVFVVVSKPPSVGDVRWVEGHGRPVADFAGASGPIVADAPWSVAEAGAMELFRCSRDRYRVLPNRPLFRPAEEALILQDLYPRAIGWDIFGKSGKRGWGTLSNAPALDDLVQAMGGSGRLAKGGDGNFIFLGLAAVAAMGLQTSDDRRFVAAIEGTEDAARHLAFQERLETTTLGSPYAAEYRALLRDRSSRESALLGLWERYGAMRPTPNDWPWPRTGTFRVVPRELVVDSVRVEDRRNGINSTRCWVPFEKGDESQQVERESGKTTHVAAAWYRDNPLVIEWSKDAVTLLRRRWKDPSGIQKPVMSNEPLWFTSGITWNVVASYFRTRLLPEGSIFGHKAPLLTPRPWAKWLSAGALLALLNSDVVEYVLRTFLGSRMELEASELRRLVIPVLSDEQRSSLEDFAYRAVAVRRSAAAGEDLAEVESQVNLYVRQLYGVAPDAKLWVVR